MQRIHVEREGGLLVWLHNRSVKADNNDSTLSSQCIAPCQFDFEP